MFARSAGGSLENNYPEKPPSPCPGYNQSPKSDMACERRGRLAHTSLYLRHGERERERKREKDVIIKLSFLLRYESP